MDIVGKSLTTCQVDPAGDSIRLNFQAAGGVPASLELPLDCVRSLLMTLPGLIERALKMRYGDDSLKLVYPMDDWSVETDACSGYKILTLATPDGFKVAFALKPADVGSLALSLVESEPDVPFSVALN